MSFRRKESFRFVFNEPLDAVFSIYVDGEPLNENNYPCKIIDISPRGMKLHTEEKMDLDLKRHNQFEVKFILNISNINALGEVIWSRPSITGKPFGIFFLDSEIGELIINELKIRRRREVFGETKWKN